MADPIVFAKQWRDKGYLWSKSLTSLPMPFTADLNPMRSTRAFTIGIVVIGAAISLIAAYSAGPVKDDFTIETRSPQGTYQVRFQGKTDTQNSALIKLSSERVKVSILKNDVIYFEKDPFFGEGSFDRHFKSAYPVIQWLNDSTLRLGGDLSAQPFSDEIEISNGTNEIQGVVEIFYGKYERFLILDFAPGAQVTLSASPQFDVSLPPASTVIYKATNLVTRAERLNTVEGLKRKSRSDGPVRIMVRITDPPK